MSAECYLALVGLNTPDLLSVLRDGAVGGELAHAGNGEDGLLNPGILRKGNKLLCQQTHHGMCNYIFYADMRFCRSRRCRPSGWEERAAINSGSPLQIIYAG